MSLQIKYRYWKSLAKHSYRYLSLNKTSTGKLSSEICKNFFFQQKIVDYRARVGAGAGAAILTSWSRSRAKMERLHNTAWRTMFFRSSYYYLRTILYVVHTR